MRSWIALSSIVVASACTGSVERPSGPAPLGGGMAAAGGVPSVTDSPIAVSGRTGPRRLTNTEYDNTTRDLLGTRRRLAASFIAEEASGFDNVASALGMTPSQYESYFNAAESLSAELFADDAARGMVLPCTPTGDDGGSCLDGFLGSFGTRALRRPLTRDERTQLKRAYGRARALGETELASASHVLTAMLASAAFLYRSEPLTDVAPGYARPLDGYELASRLSYFVWSSMPDDALLARAADGSLLRSEVLTEELARMLDDARAESLVDNFAAQWLGVRALAQHLVLGEVFPEFDALLRDSMLAEARAFIAAFVFEERPLDGFLRTDLHFVDARLAGLYGVAAPRGAGLTRLDTPIGERRGFIGLGAFLTLTSFAQRTSPTLRAKWVLEQLLCSTVPPPPPGVVAELMGAEASNAAASVENVRARLELHRSDPGCAGCHRAMDPIGLGLESFDGIGRARDHYDNGDAIDTHGELPDGTAFDGPVELAEVLADDPRFLRCATKKLLTYALGRPMDAEGALVDALHTALGTKGSFRSLVASVVLSDAFRTTLGGES
jgi:hypothetical protein